MNKNKGWYTDLLMQYYVDYAKFGSRAMFTRVPMSKYDEFKALCETLMIDNLNKSIFNIYIQF